MAVCACGGCDACATRRAREHIDADHRCGREWTCQCGPCRVARAANPNLDIDQRFRRLDELQRRHAMVRAMKG